LVGRHPDALPAGRPITRLDLIASQRGRLLDAATRTVARKGYPAATVTDIVREAGVSRSTFYEHFDGKEHCFRVGFSLGYEVVLRAMHRAIMACEGGWIDRLRTGITAYLETLAEDDEFCHAYVVEPLAAGPAIARLWIELADGFVSNFRQAMAGARRDHPELSEPPEDCYLAIVGGFNVLVSREIRNGGSVRLPELEPALLWFTLSVLLGGEGVRLALAGEGATGATAPDYS
jgi:AcrR family transcriptional regulator